MLREQPCRLTNTTTHCDCEDKMATHKADSAKEVHGRFSCDSTSIDGSSNPSSCHSQSISIYSGTSTSTAGSTQPESLDKTDDAHASSARQHCPKMSSSQQSNRGTGSSTGSSTTFSTRVSYCPHTESYLPNRVRLSLRQVR